MDAHGCDPESLRSPAALKASLRPRRARARVERRRRSGLAGVPRRRGITGLLRLTESHLACHTFPERGFAAFNLYCCRPRDEWPWPERLREALGATDVSVTTLLRGMRSAAIARAARPAAPCDLPAGSDASQGLRALGTAVARRGADLASYGKVAALIPTPSVLKLGLEGDYEGAPPFRLMGRLQLDYGAGTWDEWLMGFSDGSWAWLSEAQGRFHYMGQATLPPLPGFDQAARPDPGTRPPGTRGGRGPPRALRFRPRQLPFAVAPGSELRYADLSGPGGRMATIDYGSGDAAEALYVGSEVTLDQLGFSDLPAAEDRLTRVAGEDLKCPQCGGPVDVRAPDQTQRIACPYCGSLLDATHDLAVLEALARPELQPAIPLGSKGRLRGVEWTAIGVMERSVTVEAVRYPWREYLLYEPRQDFDGWWRRRGTVCFEPLAAGDIGDRYGQPEHEGEKFSHFHPGTATVDHVLGEFYWAVARGDETETDDYVAPPRMLSKEVADSEITWSLGTYTEPDAVWTAFRLEGSPPEPQGVGPHQPWTGAKAKQVFCCARCWPWPRSSSCTSEVSRGREQEQDDPQAGDRHPIDGHAGRAGSGRLCGADVRLPPIPTSR